MSDSKLMDIKSLPSPKGNFLLGHVLQFEPSKQHEVVERWIDECGELFKINLLGQKLIISADPIINNEILKLRPGKFKRMSIVNQILLEMGIDGVFNAEGDTWKRHRKPISDALNNKRVKGYFPIIRDKVQNLIHKFKDHADQEKVTNMSNEFMLLAIDTITVIAFGHESNTINEREDNFQMHLETVFSMLHNRMTSPIPIWRFYKRKKDKEFEKSLEIVRKTIYQIIDEAKDTLAKDPSLKERPSNFLETLLVDEVNALFTDHEIYGNVFTMLLAGEDTTANTASWALYYLSQNPEMVALMRKEAIEVYGTEEVPQTKEQLSKLIYTHAVVQEAIRIKPTIPQLFFESNEEITIGNLRIPEKTAVIVQTKLAQVQEKYFTHADKFMPDRWLKMQSQCPAFEQHSPTVIKSFGGGTRLCPGRNLSIDEIVTLLSSICKQFDLDLIVRPEDIEEKFTFTLAPENLSVKLKHIKG